MHHAETFLLETSQTIEQVLGFAVPEADVEPKPLHEAIRWSLLAGGKRLRPALVLAGGSAFGIRDTQLLHTAAAVEMIHTYSLIHDDLPAMDDDDLRRGRETCHKKFGEATAILAGDVLQTLAFKFIAEDESLPAATRLRLIHQLAIASGTPDGMAAGQQADLEGEARTLTLEEVKVIHKRKTGSLISFSAQAGALVAGSSTERLNLVRSFGDKLGLLFQITDDLLDITQTSEQLGKTAGKDVTAQKATFPALLGLEGARDYAQAVYRETLEVLDAMSLRDHMLGHIANYVLERTS